MQFSPIRHYSPSCGRRTNRRLAPPSGNPTPPRIAPRCHHFWMNIEYHYRFAGSLQRQLAKGCFWLVDPLCTFLPSFIEQAEEKNLFAVLQMVFAHPPHRFPPFFIRGPQTDVVRCRIFNFRGTLDQCQFQRLIFRRVLKYPSLSHVGNLAQYLIGEGW